MIKNFNIGDLVWAEYYNRLGVISKIITDGDYSDDNPGYTLGSPDGLHQDVVCGVREITTSSNYPNVEFKLIKVADGFRSIVQKTQI